MSTQKVLLYGASFGGVLLILNALVGAFSILEAGTLLLVVMFLAIIVHVTILWLLLQPLAGLWNKLKHALLFGLSAFLVYGLWIVAVFPVVFPSYYEDAAQVEIAVFEADDTLTDEERETAIGLIESANNPFVTAGIEFFTLVIMSGIYGLIIALIQQNTNGSKSNQDREILGESDSVFDS